MTKKNLNKKIARTSICKKELFLLFELATDSLANKEKFVQDLLCNEEEKSLRKMQYGKVKSMATDYQNKWSAIKKDYFKVWSQKPLGLLSFTLEED